jgi:hypothetical protein
MASVCRILTAGLLVAHLMVGCCAHHAHACDGEDHSLPTQGATTLPGGQCSGNHADDTHHGPPDCKGGRCSFVLPANNTIVQSLVRLCQAPAALLLDDVFASSGNSSEQPSLLTGLLLLPVRLHLANQVLLI